MDFISSTVSDFKEISFEPCSEKRNKGETAASNYFAAM